jgi:hypothetical protein
MKIQSSAYAAVIAAALLGAAPVAAGAQTDTAKARVPVTKERAAPPKTAGVPVTKEPVVATPDTTRRISTGEVVLPVDTMAPNIHRFVAPPPVVAPPVAPPAAAPPVVPPQKPQRITRYLFGTSGFYIGAGGGTAVPYNELSDLGYDSGLDLTIPIGWHRPGRMLGLRATLSFDQVHADASGGTGPLPAMNGSGPDPKIYGGTLDAVVKVPIGGARDGRGLSLYAVGGGGAYLFRGFGGASQLANALGADKVGNSSKNVHKLGVDAGAGMEWGIGPTAVFVESRWVNVFTNGSTSGNDYLRWIPIAAGMTIR